MIVALWLLAIQGLIGAFDTLYYHAGERVTHAIMGILYGAMVAGLIRVMASWWALPTALVVSPPAIPDALRWGLLVMAGGVAASGLRDLYAAYGLPYGGWPWE